MIVNNVRHGGEHRWAVPPAYALLDAVGSFPDRAGRRYPNFTKELANKIFVSRRVVRYVDHLYQSSRALPSHSGSTLPFRCVMSSVAPRARQAVFPRVLQVLSGFQCLFHFEARGNACVVVRRLHTAEVTPLCPGRCLDATRLAAIPVSQAFCGSRSVCIRSTQEERCLRAD